MIITATPDQHYLQLVARQTWSMAWSLAVTGGLLAAAIGQVWMAVAQASTAKRQSETSKAQNEIATKQAEAANRQAEIADKQIRMSEASLDLTRKQMHVALESADNAVMPFLSVVNTFGNNPRQMDLRNSGLGPARRITAGYYDNESNTMLAGSELPIKEHLPADASFIFTFPSPHIFDQGLVVRYQSMFGTTIEALFHEKLGQGVFNRTLRETRQYSLPSVPDGMSARGHIEIM
jgi:hypothetical protein